MSLIFRLPNANGPSAVAAAFGARAAYDSQKGSGYTDVLPAIGDFDATAQTAPGSDSPNDAGATYGPVIGTPIVSSVYVSSQLPEGVQTVPVTSGDTSSFSDDTAIHPGTALLPVSAPRYSASETGAGEGAAGHHRHPNNANTPTGSAQ